MAGAKQQHIAILGSGAWGAAFGNAVASAQCPVVFWHRRHDCAAAAAAGAAHAVAVEALPQAAADAALIVVGASSGGFVPLLRQLGRLRAPLLWLTKGFDAASGKPLHSAAAEVLPADACFGAVSGPSFAQEVARGLPAALTLAMTDTAQAEAIRTRLHRPHLRLYVCADLAGVSIAGAIKNIIAIAAGICDGLHFGENARAALVARGLEEMGALAQALGGQRETLLGLAGVGDLLLTCCSDLSRNRRLGLALAAAAPLPQDTCEGRTAAAAAAALAAKCGLQLPIIATVAEVLAGRCSAAQAAAALLRRPPR